MHELSAEVDAFSLNDEFFVRKCYELHLEDSEKFDLDKFLWKKHIPPKVSFMFWENFHKSLPTRYMLSIGAINV